MDSTFWMTAQEAEDEIKAREALAHAVRITDKEPSTAAYCMWLILMQEDAQKFLYAAPCWQMPQFRRPEVTGGVE